ncbi:MAG: metalloprotease PmbA [Candidatus Dasytiphilus stammeri]
MKIFFSKIVAHRIKLHNIVSKVLHLAKKLGMDGVEVTITKNMGLNIKTRYGKLNNIQFNNDNGLNINVYYKHHIGSAFCNQLNSNIITDTVSAAADIARSTSQDICHGIADYELLAFNAPNLDLFHPLDIDAQEAISIASRAETAALNTDKRIINTEGGNFNICTSIKVFGNSNDMLQSYCSSYYYISSCVIAKQNNRMERDYAWTVSRKFTGLHSAEWIGNECARRTISRLNSRKQITMNAPIIFAAEVAVELFYHLADAINGNNVYRKKTFLIDALGRQIFPEWLSVEEQPHILQGIASKPFDNQGVLTQKNMIIKNGILNTWLLNSYSARKLNMKNTGHSGGGIYNWCIHVTECYNFTFSNLLKKMDKGLVVYELMGQGVNNINGDYSRGAVGFWVENGVIQYPVSEVTIASNLRYMWANIQAMSNNDIEMRRSVQCGSLLISEMKIAGLKK